MFYESVILTNLCFDQQEEMERNRKSSGSASGGSYGTRMREVACPTCTVHLQVGLTLGTQM